MGRFHRLGAKIVAGTDAIQRFGDFALGLELLHRAGLSPMEVIVAATSLAAQAVGMDETVGTLKPGMAADLIYLDGDPLRDLGALSGSTPWCSPATWWSTGGKKRSPRRPTRTMVGRATAVPA